MSADDEFSESSARASDAAFSTATVAARARTVANHTASSDPSGGSAYSPFSFWNAFREAIIDNVSRSSVSVGSTRADVKGVVSFSALVRFRSVFAFAFDVAFAGVGSYPSKETPSASRRASAFSGNVPSACLRLCLSTHSPRPASARFSGTSHDPTTFLYSTSSSNHISQVRLLSPPAASFTVASKPAMSSKYSCSCVKRPH